MRLRSRQAIRGRPGQTSIESATVAAMARSIWSRPFDLVMVLYFVSHIPITLFVDTQSILPREWYPAWAREALDWHIAKHTDHLVQTNPIWFVSFVWGELLFQLPLFLPLAIGIIRESPWVRIPSIIYGTHVATTLQAILAEFAFSQTVASPNWVVLPLYLPYMILPLALVLRMTLWDWPSKPSKAANKAKAL